MFDITMYMSELRWSTTILQM